MASILSLLQLKGRQAEAATARGVDVAVTAGAGSGKTRALVGRYLGLLEEGRPLRSLVAVTFTEKAAREMRTRIRSTIEQWLAEGAVANRDLWESAFAELDAARIGTIHSLCAAILRAHPAEANVDPAFTVLEENAAAILKARAVEVALAWAMSDTEAARLFGLLKEYRLRAAVTELLERRLDAAPAFDGVGDRLLGRWSGELAAWLEARLDIPAWLDSLEVLRTVQARQPDDKLETARCEVLARWDEVCAARAEQDWDAVFTGLISLRGSVSTGGVKGNWEADDLAAAREAMAALRTHYDGEIAPLVSKEKPVSWALDRQVAEALPGLCRLFQQAVAAYQQLKDEGQSLDFDDLEMRAATLLSENPAVRARWQSEVSAVLVDEFQDTNERQRRIVYALAEFSQGAQTPLLPAKERGLGACHGPSRRGGALFVVGDAKQCLVPGTPILIPTGYRPIECISPGDEVIAASGRDRTETFRVEQTYQRPYTGIVMTITTAGGFEIRCTPEHILFTRLIPDLEAYYVYLMRHPTKGFRIGVTRGYRTGERRITNGFDSRCRQEGGDAIWVLRRCHSRKEAQMYEQLYLAQYGLPGLCFKSKEYQELDQEAIDFVFASVPTRERAAALANDLGIDLSIPHYIPTVAKETVTLTYFGGKGNRQYAAHRIHFETRDAQVAQNLTGLGVRKAKPSHHYPQRWRIGTERTGYDTAYSFASQIAERADTLLVERFALTTDKRWAQTPAGQVFPGMQIPVVDDKVRVVPDEIVRVTRQQFEGPVYDIAISQVHNYVANRMIVHNSIYRFRGADVTVFRRVQADVSAAGGQHIDLDLTFRPHKPLLTATNALLQPVLGIQDDQIHPYDVPFAPLRAYRQSPAEGIREPFIELHLGIGDDADQGRRAAAAGLARRLVALYQSEGVEWGQVALLFRASTHFNDYEDALERVGVPFVTVAGRGFYDRPEVRDLLNALSAIAAPDDDLALAGLLRSPAFGLTDAALYLLRWGPDGQRRPMWAALNGDLASLDPTDAERAEHARSVIAGLHELVGRAPVAEVLKRFLDATYYRAALRLVPGGERPRRNLDKLLADAHRSGLVSVGEFLEYVGALRDVAARESEAPVEAGGAVQLMTVHKAKGLEFPVVVIADAAHGGGSAGPAILVESDLGVLLDVRQDEARPAMHQWAVLRHSAMEEAEDKRLLYVAATRAREKLLVSGHVKISTAKADPGRLLLSGWLARLGEVVGLSDVRLPEMLTASQALDLNWDGGPLACVLHPPLEELAADFPSVVSEVQAAMGSPLTAVSAAVSLPPDLVAPLAFARHDDADDKTQDRESDPPPRVWRVVPKAVRPTGPAWVVGTLVHAALRRWRFPDGEGLEAFLRPYALEAGLTDEAEIRGAIAEARRLLARFQAHPLYDEMAAAERYHEVPYSVTLDDGPRSGIVDLLYRTDSRWTIAEFKTDRLKDEAEMRERICEEKYDEQVRGYVQAVTRQLGEPPRALLVFLNVENQVRIVPL